MATKPRLLQNGKLPQATLAARGHEFDAIVTSAPIGAAAWIEALPNLKVIAGLGVGPERQR